MLASEKRAVKSINDVTVDRLGDGLGGFFAQTMVLYGGTLANPLMLGAAALTSAVSFLLAGRLNHAYVHSLERSLTQHAVDLDVPDEPEDQLSEVFRPSTAGIADNARPAKPVEPPPPPPWLRESVARQWVDLISGDGERIRHALRNGPPLERPLLPYAIPLLARKSLASVVREALETSGRPQYRTDFGLSPGSNDTVQCSLRVATYPCDNGQRSSGRCAALCVTR